ILRGVRKLEPGSRLTWRPGEGAPRSERYWEPPLAAPELDPPDGDELERLLDEAVRRQMISDVPIGAFLSGGIDSSVLVALMARHSERPVRTFSVAFESAQTDESTIARRVAERFATDHTTIPAREL